MIEAELQGKRGDVEAFQRVEIIQHKRDGWTNREIAEAVGLGEDQVRRVIRQAVDAARADERQLVQERYHLHDERLEFLYAQVMKALHAAVVFDDKIIRAAIMILERQARLHGLDKTRTQASGAFGWLETASPDELVRLAKERGIALPATFQLPS